MYARSLAILCGSLALCSTALAAEAAHRLDYRSPADCPAEGRFSDEVAARLGYQPFGTNGSEVSIRIGTADGGYFGTLDLDTGTRMLNGSSCQEVFDGLVAATAVLMDSSAATPPQPVPVASTRVTAKIESTKPNTTIALIHGRGVGSGSTSTGGTVTVLTTYYNDLCKTPCTVELDPGMVELSAYGGGRVATSKQFEFAKGESVHLLVKPRKMGLFWGGWAGQIVGAAALVTGGTMLAIKAGDDTAQVELWAPVTAGGALLLGGGTAMRYFSRGSFERVPLGLTVSGEF